MEATVLNTLYPNPSLLTAPALRVPGLSLTRKQRTQGSRPTSTRPKRIGTIEEPKPGHRKLTPEELESWSWLSELMALTDPSFTQTVQTTADIFERLHDGYIVGTLVEMLTRKRVQGLQRQAKHAAIYQVWQKVLGVLRTELCMPTTFLFCERDLAGDIVQFNASIYGLLKDLQTAYKRTPIRSLTPVEMTKTRPKKAKPVQQLITNQAQAQESLEELEECKNRWLEMLKLEPLTDSLAPPSWRSGRCFLAIARSLYSVLKSKTHSQKSLRLPYPNTTSQRESIDNIKYTLSLLSQCGVPSLSELDEQIDITSSSFFQKVLGHVAEQYPIRLINNHQIKYNPIELCVLERSVMQWLFSLDLFSRPPYLFSTPPRLNLLLNHLRSGLLFLDLAIIGLKLGKLVCSEVNLASLLTMREANNFPCFLGLKVLLLQKTFDKTSLVSILPTTSGDWPDDELVRVTTLSTEEMLILLEALHRSWNNIISKKTGPYIPFPPSFPLDGPLKYIDPSFTRPPMEVMIEGNIALPEIWSLPEVRGLPIHFQPDGEVVSIL
ncbi:hypothetical protein GMRT_15990 [Giardia muris]|uniref:Uncharacterized protein n=1 Tax=Giardia muris TaxID=5742 RepID=A0A4Z1SX28_GIAMU|nr:hypothetical protein GMRT_15990 [Giardia muris]|eukprot:TNJ29395.1 hypothetical protein GMRT_15990 [Giardia muris]